MKRIILLKILRRLNSTPNLKKKLKIFAALAAVVLVIGLSFTIWAGVTLVRAVASGVQNVDFSHKAAVVEDSLKSFSVAGLVNCWEGAQNYLEIQPWLARPVIDNLKNLSATCFEGKPAKCDGHECKRNKIKVNTAEREMI